MESFRNFGSLFVILTQPCSLSSLSSTIALKVNSSSSVSAALDKWNVRKCKGNTITSTIGPDRSTKRWRRQGKEARSARPAIVTFALRSIRSLVNEERPNKRRTPASVMFAQCVRSRLCVDTFNESKKVMHTATKTDVPLIIGCVNDDGNLEADGIYVLGRNCLLLSQRHREMVSTLLAQMKTVPAHELATAFGGLVQDHFFSSPRPN